MTHVDEVIALRDLVKRLEEKIRELEGRQLVPPLPVPQGAKPAFERR